MAGRIEISTQVLRDTAETVRRLKESLNDTLKDANTTVQNLESTWDSDAGRRIREGMRSMESRFEQYRNIVETYAAFLETTADEYDRIETDLTRNANSVSEFH